VASIFRVRGLIFSALLAAVVLGATAPAISAAGKPSFEIAEGATLRPGFGWSAREYAARCQQEHLTFEIAGSSGWRGRLRGRFRAGSFTQQITVGAGQAATITFRNRQRDQLRRFHVRCLPDDFPDYSFRRFRSGGPGLYFIQLANQYAAVFNGDGVPVWWYRADGYTDDAKMLADGTISWSSVDATSYQTGPFDILDLTGEVLRTVGHSDLVDVHDLQLLPNGNYLIGEQDWRSGIDASEFGGSANGAAIGIEIQQLKPKGKQVWSWDSFDHIDLAETPQRWWEQIRDNTYWDIVHWNAVEPDGRYMYLSFRHLDALYKVDRRSGDVVWKLGGTETPESLEIKGYDQGEYPLGGQHDVRVQPNGTVTVFNNRTDLDPAVPQAQRYRINEDKGTARLVEAVSDPRINGSACCGSARRLADKDWLVAWGGYSGFVGAYDDEGRVIFRLRTPGAFTYRANPLPEGHQDTAPLRQAMDAMTD
jgi:hypothetical protein